MAIEVVGPLVPGGAHPKMPPAPESPLLPTVVVVAGGCPSTAPMRRRASRYSASAGFPPARHV